MARVKNTRQIMDVLQAYLDGKEIEWCYNQHLGTAGEKWQFTKVPAWEWTLNTYRVKQEPREYSVVIDRNGKAVGVGNYEDKFVDVSNGALLGSTIIKVREVL